MKVLMINVVCGIRSTGRICTDLAMALESQGHEIKIAYGRENVPKQFQKYAVRIGSNFDVRTHGLRARLLDDAGFGSKEQTKRFIQWIEEYNPDVIHLHNIHGYYINVEILFDYLRTCGKRIIWTLHDCWAFTGHTAYCDAVNCNRWVYGCYECPLIKEYPMSYIDRSHKNWNKKKNIFSGIPNMTIVTPSKWLGSWVKRSFLKEYPLYVINNGIDVRQFYPIKSDFRKEYGLEDKFILLGVATSWDKMKGLTDYYKLADLLGKDFKIVLVGLTKEQIKRIPHNVLGIERTANVKELAKIYSAADLFVNLSYCENYPTVNIEALSCGTQVLTYKTGGSPEIVEEFGGVVVEQGNVAKVAEAIQSMMVKGIDKVNIDKSKFDNSRVIDDYLKLYYGNNLSLERLKLLFLTNVPSPYRVNFFDELGKICDVTVLYQKHNSSERNSKWITESNNNFKSVFLKGKSTGVDNSFCLDVVKYLDKSYDAVIICGNASPTEILAIEYCKARGIPYCMEGDGAFAKAGNNIKEKLKKHLISGGALFFSTCREHDKYYIHYGADANKIVRYRFSSLMTSDVLDCPISKEEKSRIRKGLNIKEEQVVLAVGQFIYRKGFDLLLEAAVELPSTIGIYIIGDEPTKEYLSYVRENKLNNVHFEGFKTKNELKEYYKASDIFVLPTREDIWGLVINEAMAYGLPVITTDRCNAGLELVKNGENGYIVPIDDSNAIAQKISLTLKESESMGMKALSTIRDYTIENMAQDHFRIIQERQIL